MPRRAAPNRTALHAADMCVETCVALNVGGLAELVVVLICSGVPSVDILGYNSRYNSRGQTMTISAITI